MLGFGLDQTKTCSWMAQADARHSPMLPVRMFRYPGKFLIWRRKTMGALLPVGSGPDAEIVDKLNKLFSGGKLAVLRNHNNNKEKLFQANRRLSRIAFRLGAYPAQDYP